MGTELAESAVWTTQAGRQLATLLTGRPGPLLPAWAGPQTSGLGMLGAGALLLHAVGDFRALVGTWKGVASAHTSSLGVGLSCSWGPTVGICGYLAAEASEAANRGLASLRVV